MDWGGPIEVDDVAADDPADEDCPATEPVCTFEDCCPADDPNDCCVAGEPESCCPADAGTFLAASAAAAAAAAAATLAGVFGILGS